MRKIRLPLSRLVEMYKDIDGMFANMFSDIPDKKWKRDTDDKILQILRSKHHNVVSYVLIKHFEYEDDL